MCFPVQGNGRQGGGGSELMQMGGAGSSRGSLAKPSVQRSRHYADLPTARDREQQPRRRSARGGGMLTIMISDANPGISPPAPPHWETGYHQPPMGINILPRTANQRGDRGHFLRVVPDPNNTRRKMGKGRWRLHQVERTFLVDTDAVCGQS